MRPDRSAFSVGLLSCHLSDQVSRYMTNPFTGEKTPVYADPGLNDTEQAGVLSLLRKFNAQSEAADEYYISFPDNASITVQISGLQSSFPVIGAEVDIVCRTLRDDLLDFLLQFASMANMALITLTDTDDFTPSVRVVSEGSLEAVRRRWPDASVVADRNQLRDWVVKVVGSREVY